MDADIFVSGKKKLRIKKYPDTCGWGLRCLSSLLKYESVCSYVAIGSTLVIVRNPNKMLLMLLLIPGNNSSFVSSATRGHSNVAIDSKQQ